MIKQKKKKKKKGKVKYILHNNIFKALSHSGTLHVNDTDESGAYPGGRLEARAST